MSQGRTRWILITQVPPRRSNWPFVHLQFDSCVSSSGFAEHLLFKKKQGFRIHHRDWEPTGGLFHLGSDIPQMPRDLAVPTHVLVRGRKTTQSSKLLSGRQLVRPMACECLNILVLGWWAQNSEKYGTTPTGAAAPGPPTKADGLSLPPKDLSKVPAQLFPETTATADFLSTWPQDTCVLSRRTVYNSGPQPFWHQGPISWKIIFPSTSSGGLGGWFQDDSRAFHSLCTLFLI